MDFVSAAPAFLVAGEGGNEILQEDGQLLEFGVDDFVLVIQRPSKANLHIESRDGAAVTLILDGESMSVSTVFNQTFFYDMTEQPGDINTIHCLQPNVFL
jgi:outer membrane lipoprotein-sorting protein